MRSINRFLCDESGATAVEYGLMIAAFSGGIVLVLGALQGQLKTVFTILTAALASVTG